MEFEEIMRFRLASEQAFLRECTICLHIETRNNDAFSHICRTHSSYIIELVAVCAEAVCAEAVCTAIV